MKCGIIGRGYWGQIIMSKLDNWITKEPFDEADWMFIATPPEYHYEYTRRFLLEGKNVFCEKPLCTTIEEAEELVNLSRETGNLLYIDNIFMLREEFISIGKTDANYIRSTWRKYGPFKDSLFNDLLYHDLYMFISLLGDREINGIEVINNNRNSLHFNYLYGGTLIEIRYDRNCKGEKIKTIQLGNEILDLSKPKNDALKESIDNCFRDKVDYRSNHSLSLHTLRQLIFIREQI